jgi:hypothetical protein
MRKPEYTEGSEALENFERGMIALFKVLKGGWPTSKTGQAGGPHQRGK